MVVLGAGHNGLVCAGYLARAGYRVKVLERRGVVGGAAVTEEIIPGYRNSTLSWVVGLLPAKIIHELELERFGLKIINRRSSGLQIFPDGRHLLLGLDKTANLREYAKFSETDAVRMPAYERQLSEIADLVRELTFETPPRAAGGIGAMVDMGKLLYRLKRSHNNHYVKLASLLGKSAGDMLDEWFESEEIKGHLAFTAIVGNFVSPYFPGSSVVLLHSVYGETNGVKGAFGHPYGGMGAITRAMADSARSKGVEIEVNAAVMRVIVENGFARGAVLQDGTEIRARAVVSSLNPKLLLLDLIDKNDLPADVVERMKHWRCRGGVIRLNLALSELPRFAQMPNLDANGYTSMFKISPSMSYLDQAYDDAKTGNWSRKPAVMWSFPSTLDDSLAPPGHHVASVFAQHFHPKLSGARSWDDCKHEAAESVITLIDQQCPNFRNAIVGMKILSPLDLEREYGLLGGDIFHGQMHLDQSYVLRPLAGYADYRAPIRNLFMCGSGTHPGGSVTGMPGHNAAREILNDVRRRRL